MLDSAGRKRPRSGNGTVAARRGIAAMLAAKVAHGLGHGPIGAEVPRGRRARWSARMSCK
jgi:hypothetical protein